MEDQAEREREQGRGRRRRLERRRWPTLARYQLPLSNASAAAPAANPSSQPTSAPGQQPTKETINPFYSAYIPSL